MPLTRRLANLPMYDMPELRAATDGLWSALAALFRIEGIDDAPERLSRTQAPEAQWTSPALLFSQTCGYPLTHALAGRVTVVGTPCYSAPGCTPGNYRSLLVVHGTNSVRYANELPGGARWAVNSHASLSGYWLPLSSCGSAARESGGIELVTGSHRESLRAVRDGVADYCWVDCVTYALLLAQCPDELRSLVLIAHSESAPGLPLITGASTTAAELAALRRALRRLCAEARYAELRASLMLEGFAEASYSDYAYLARLGPRQR